MNDDRRSVIFERFLDDVELYLDLKRDLNRKKKAAYESENPDAYLAHWEEEDTVEALRERARRALDEYVDSKPDPVEQA